MQPALKDSPPPYGTVVFDCDSTLSGIEGIDELAGERRAEIEELTRQAMDGSLPLEEVYGRRLGAIRPTRAQLERLGERYVETLLPNAAELSRALQSLGKRVVLVSGGLLPAVRRLGEALGVPSAEVHAVDLRFAADGSYAGYDESSPLARSGGKLEVLARIAAAPKAGALCFVGDGITDLEAAGEVARFVAFGGVVRRPKVFAGAKVHCESPDLAALLPLLLLPAEIVMLRTKGRFGALLRAADSFASREKRP